MVKLVLVKLFLLVNLYSFTCCTLVPCSTISAAFPGMFTSVITQYESFETRAEQKLKEINDLKDEILAVKDQIAVLDDNITKIDEAIVKNLIDLQKQTFKQRK